MTTAALTTESPVAAIPFEPLSGFHEFFEEHTDTVYLTALRVTGNPADAEDVLQTVFLRLLDQYQRVEPGRASSYLRRAATNAAIDLLRKRKTENASLADGATDNLPAVSPPPLLKERLRRAIAQLEPRDAELFLLRNVEGFTLPELAELMGMERSTVGTRLFRIRQTLQRVIEQ